ncbi:MAG: lipopolysaccharide biosynthesis protein [Tannerella sp.]|nr:lipopolysaccharide biosynthesis protein [Tannerella sp.]
MAGEMKRLAKDTATYGLSSIIGRFLNWMLVPLYTRVLENTAEYGVVTNLYGYTALFIVLLTYGMETGLFRFINKKEEQEPMRVYATAIYSVAFTSLLFVLFILLFLNPVSGALRYDAHPEYVGMMGCIVAVDAFCCIPFAWLRYKNRPVRFACLKLFGIFSNISLNLFFLVICPKINADISWFYRPGYGVGYILLSNALTTALTFLLLIPEMLPGFRAAFSRQRLRQMLHYSFPILILGIAGILNQSFAIISFPFLFEDKDYADSQLGIYGACLKIAVVMILFTQAFRYAYEPFIFSRNRDTDSRTAYVRAMKYFIIFSLVIFLGVMFYLDLLKYFIDGPYRQALAVIPVIMLGELFYGIYYNLSVWYKLTDQTRWGARFSITGCAVTVLIIIGFVPRYGYMACAWAAFASNLLMMLLSYFTGQRKFPVAYDLRSAFTYGAIAAVCYIAGMLPEIASDPLQLAYRTVILLIFTGIILKREIPSSGIKNRYC